MPRIVDISPPIDARLAVWPGDVPFQPEATLAWSQGHHLELGAIRTTLHLGAHTDAPVHYDPAGPGIGEVDLEPYWGPCQVVRVHVPRGARVRPADLPGPIRAPRVLLHTGTFPDPTSWNDDFASLSPELVDHLADQGVVLVGLDTPSIDPMHDRDLHSHKAVARRGLRVLEGVVLEGVEPGVWELVALPLRLRGLDGSPVRAVLRG